MSSQTESFWPRTSCLLSTKPENKKTIYKKKLRITNAGSRNCEFHCIVGQSARSGDSEIWRNHFVGQAWVTDHCKMRGFNFQNSFGRNSHQDFPWTRGRFICSGCYTHVWLLLGSQRRSLWCWIFPRVKMTPTVMNIIRNWTFSMEYYTLYIFSWINSYIYIQ